MSLAARDKKWLWHPFTQAKTAEMPIAIERAKGSYLYDEQGHAYLDLISSWWVNLHGHAHPEIARCLYEQALQLEHVIFAGFTHLPAVALCEELQPLLPSPLSRFFFSDNGSTAVEVALKMAYQYWRNQGDRTRTTFLSFEGGYHGDTFGAMAVGARSGFHSAFTDLCFNVLSLPYPATWMGDTDVEAKEAEALRQLDQHLDKDGHRIAAIILEPLMQGAAGMRLSRSSFIKAVVERVRAARILVIFDEVMTGFGRTGSIFATHQIGVTPDFICLSKGLTGGFLPLALTVTTEAVYAAFWHDDWKYALAHGHSYTANPLACAAARASLRLLQQPLCQEAIRSLSTAHETGLSSLSALGAAIERPRKLGTISAFDMQDGKVLATLRSACLETGLLVRPIGNTLYLLPPYSTTVEELEAAYHTIGRLLAEHRTATRRESAAWSV